MAEDPEGDTLGMSESELVSEMESRLSGAAGMSMMPTGGELDLSELSLSTEPCCRFPSRVTAANVVGLADLLDFS